MAEHQLQPPVLGVVWDGTGYGIDGTVWGGEFLLVGEEGFSRAASLRPFPLPGGDAAAREPRRSLLGLLYGMYGEELLREHFVSPTNGNLSHIGAQDTTLIQKLTGKLQFTNRELKLLMAALTKGINAPLTSSMGRLFDGVAALAGLRNTCSFEGQAAMALEYAALDVKTDECYPHEITPDTNGSQSCSRIIEWKPMLAAMFMETSAATLSAKFHNTLAEIVVELARQVGMQQVALTGGCFQNRALLNRCIPKLHAEGFTPYWQQRIPPNDGGIALGQIAAALLEETYVFSGARSIDQY
jgi:hydrogenase maturation protein HypF